MIPDRTQNAFLEIRSEITDLVETLNGAEEKAFAYAKKLANASLNRLGDGDMKKILSFIALEPLEKLRVPAPNLLEVILKTSMMDSLNGFPRGSGFVYVRTMDLEHIVKPGPLFREKLNAIFEAFAKENGETLKIRVFKMKVAKENTECVELTFDFDFTKKLS